MAMKLGIQPGEVVLDVGCGVGGPAREIAVYTDCNVVGLNNNDYQYFHHPRDNIDFLELNALQPILLPRIYRNMSLSLRETL
jgi:cyclopropane fatty-acyl-phospholipid synthase-like methyltransferase